MFGKVLIANRGEIAMRIHRACREMGIRTVAVHSTADADAMHVRLADEAVCIGPPPATESYLNIPALIAAAEVTGADAVHPGYGFLAENARFAEIVRAHGVVFIGPDPEHIRLMGDKLAARNEMRARGLALVPGSDGPVENVAEARDMAAEIGYPVLVKASAGGGGRGMKVARSPGELAEALDLAAGEARQAFGDGAVFLEKYLAAPRHIEIQVLADDEGRAVHFGERDCSLQRRHQKLLEEAPSPALNAAARAATGERAVAAISAIGYRGVGTLEFLLEEGEFYFIEMNTRLQVEHPVTEMITGIDLVREQIRAAAGEPLDLEQSAIVARGHAIECRIAAEDPVSFAPRPGTVTDYHPPGGLGVRVDSALYAGYTVPPHYDSMVAKLVVHGASRGECLMRLKRSLEEFVIDGIPTTLPLHRRLVDAPDFVAGRYDVHWLERFASEGPSGAAEEASAEAG